MIYLSQLLGNSIYDVAALLDHEQVTTTQLYARQKSNVKRDCYTGVTL